MDEYKDSTTSLVADVDCTTAGKSLCEKHSIGGYPTIKHGDPDDLKDYDGGRDLSSLKKFAAESLGPSCGPAHIDLCDESEKEAIVKFQQLSEDELDKQISESEQKIQKISSAAEKSIAKLNSKIADLRLSVEKENKKRDDKVSKESRKMGLKQMKAVKAAKEEL